MITSIRLVNFKNFADETLRVGPFTVIVGANASGKSNIRDAFRFLHGIGRGYTLAEIIGGRYGAGGQIEWEPIRGTANEIARIGQPEFSLEVELESNGMKLHYTIQVGSHIERLGASRVIKEELRANSGMVYEAESHDANLNVRAAENCNVVYPCNSDQPALTQILARNRIARIFDNRHALNLRLVLENMRFLDLTPDRMRLPAFPRQTVLGDGGENLPTVLEEICADPKRKKILADWLSELTPMDVADFEFPRDPSGRVHLMLCEANGRKVSAYSASDGTLRFLAMLAALLDTNPAGLYFFEEIDNGIHPARQSLLLELIEKQSAKGGIQVVTTTHAPDLLTLVNDSTFENMSVVCRLEDSQDAIIRPVAELPNARELRTSGRGLGGLLAEGWMETALGFTENHGEAEGDGE